MLAFLASVASSAEVHSEPIVSAPSDKRLYRGLTLANDMKVMLISDPTAVSASAAVDVNIGAFSDPNQQKLDALGTYCTKTKKDTSHAPDPHPDHPARPDTGPKKRFVMRADGGFHPHGSQ